MLLRDKEKIGKEEEREVEKGRIRRRGLSVPLIVNIYLPSLNK